MQSTLPEYLDLIQKAKLGTEIEGEWPINKLDRIADQLVNDGGMLIAKLELGQQEKLLFLKGSVSVNLAVTCQRCMQAMDLPLNAVINLALITNESQEDQLPEGFEPLLVDDSKMRLPDILEDELLLAMPLVPMHDNDCSEYLQQQKQRQAVEAEQDKAEKEKQNPFSVLKDLL